jgi:hypothetical protein
MKYGNNVDVVNKYFNTNPLLFAVLRIPIWIHIRTFEGLLDPDPLVRGADPDPAIIKQK